MKRLKRIWEKNIRNVAIMVAIALVIGTVSVSAGVNDNLGSSIDKILGPVNASLNGSFNASSTNGKLNQMKKDVSEAKGSMETLLAPYLSSLTVWVDSTNASYSGKTVSVTNSKGEKKTAAFVLKNGHYEATFSKLVRNKYKIDYPFILSSGMQLDFATQFKLAAGNNTRQLFVDLQQMSIADIQAWCKSSAITSIAKVGDTFSDGTYTYTIIGINQDKPSDANGNALSSSQYGDVLTVMPLGAPAGAGNGTAVTVDASKTPWGTGTAPMNSSDTSSGSWKSSKMRSSTMASYLAKLPADTQKAIGYVQKITGQSGSDTNITTGDKCFLLSGKEIFGGNGGPGNGNGSYCTSAEANATFQYQYFANIATTYQSRDINVGWWWLRSPNYIYSNGFCYVNTGNTSVNDASRSFGVFPAFCIY